jgi:hypothetical protein
MLFFKLSTYLFLLEASRDCKGTNIICYPSLLRGDKIRHGNKTILITVNLLSKSVELAEDLTVALR